MIKKVNIALLVVGVALFGIKLLTMVSIPDRPAPAAPAAEVSNAVSDLAPTVYYFRLPGYAAEDRITHRNGYFNDLIRAIFPRAMLVEVMSDDELPKEKFLSDPRAVAVYESSYASNIVGCASSRSPLGSCEICLWSLRKSEWVYDGTANALQSVRAGVRKGLNSAQVVSLLKARGLDESRLKVYAENVDIVEVLRKGEADVFLGLFVSHHQFFEIESTKVLTSCRNTPPVGRIDMHLLSSGADPEFTAALFRDYEEGLKRIEASGERRRIAEYYGFAK